MRRTCERLGCGQPTAVVYGMSEGASGSMTLWIDRYVPDGKPIADVRGALCVTHGERLTAPVGWSFEDRRERAPRLFKPSVDDRPNLTVVPDKPAKTRRERAKDLPRPSLFNEAAEAPKPVAVTPQSVAPQPAAPKPVAAPVPTPAPAPAPRVVTPILKDSQRIDSDDERGGDETGDITGSWVPHFDPDDDLGGVLDATGPMLRDAFRPRHNGRARD
ncbi:MAG: hypothetical protein FGM29_10185 [Actinobacteria bacterium]|nr:hypothetical protein [Actinomycetota bacterium]